MRPASQPQFSPGALLAARKRAGLTHEDLAYKAGVSVTSVSRYERGARQVHPRLDIVLRLSQALGVELSELVR